MTYRGKKVHQTIDGLLVAWDDDEDCYLPIPTDPNHINIADEHDERETNP